MILHSQPKRRKSVSYISINSVKHRESIIKNCNARNKYNSKSSKSVKGKKLPTYGIKQQRTGQYAEDNYVIVNGTIKADISRAEKEVGQMLKLLLPNINNDEKLSIFGKNLRNKRVIFSNIEAMKVIWKCILGQGKTAGYSRTLLDQLIKSFIDDPKMSNTKGNTKMEIVKNNSKISRINSKDNKSYSVSNSYQEDLVLSQSKDDTEIDRQILKMERLLIDSRGESLEIIKSTAENAIALERQKNSDEDIVTEDSLLMKALRIQIWKNQKILFAKKICGIQEHYPRKNRYSVKQQAKQQPLEKFQCQYIKQKIDSDDQNKVKFENLKQNEQNIAENQLKLQFENLAYENKQGLQQKQITIYLQPPYPPFRTTEKQIITNYGVEFYKRKVTNFLKYKRAIRSAVAKRMQCMPQCHYCRKLFTCQEFFKCNNIPRQKASQSTFQTDPYMYHRIFYKPQLSTDYTSFQRYVHPYYLYYRDENGCRACNRCFCKQCFENYIEPLQVNRELDKNQMVCSYCMGTCACECCFKISWIVRAMAFYFELNGNLDLLKTNFLFPPRVGDPLVRVQMFQYQMRKFQTKRAKKERKAILKSKELVISKMHNPQAQRQLLQIPQKQLNQLKNKYTEVQPPQKQTIICEKTPQKAQNKQLKLLKPQQVQKNGSKNKKLTLMHFKFQKKKKQTEESNENALKNSANQQHKEQFDNQSNEFPTLPKRAPQVSTQYLINETNKEVQNTSKTVVYKEKDNYSDFGNIQCQRQVAKLIKSIDHQEQQNKPKLKQIAHPKQNCKKTKAVIKVDGKQLIQQQICQKKHIEQNMFEVEVMLSEQNGKKQKSITQQIQDEVNKIGKVEEKLQGPALRFAKKSSKNMKMPRSSNKKYKMLTEANVIQLPSQSCQLSSSSSVIIVPMIDLIQSSSE